MFQTLKVSLKDEEIRKRLLFTFLMLIVFRLGNAIPIPFIDRAVIAEQMAAHEDGIFSLLNLLSGGSLARMSVFALSIYPYITASIIIQLLTVAIPRLEEVARDGEQGRKKIASYTKFGAVFLGLFEGYAIVQGLFGNAIVDKSTTATIIMLLSVLAGTMFLVWLGEVITQNGVGNGISIIIFLGIVSSFPNQIAQINQQRVMYGLEWWRVALLIVLSIIILVIVVAITQGERRIPVQYAKRVVGRKMYGGQSTHIPVKVNMAGVMPVIFASSLLTLPQTIALFIGQDKMPKWFAHVFTVNTTSGLVIYSIVQLLLIILFAYFYTAIQFNTVEYAKNLQQYGGFIPGIRPGRPTGEYLQKISNRITFIGALSLALVSSAPMLLTKLLGVQIVFGGTSIIIVVGVVLETLKQMESMVTMRHYKGFLR